MPDEVKRTTGKPEINEIATAQKDIDVFSGWLSRRENPDPILLSESGGLGLKLYDEAARDPHAASVLQSRYLAVAGCEWEVMPADESKKAVDIADFVNDALSRTNFTQAMMELMQAVLYGFWVSEIMWTSANGQWLPAKIMGKHPRRFVFGLDRDLRMLTPENMTDGEGVPDRKFICFSYGSSDNPYGIGLGQKIWWPVWFKKHGIKYWLIFLEKFGMPTGIGKYPPGTDPTDQDKLLDAIDAIQTETGITIPESMTVELLEASRTGNVTYEALCDYMDRQISKAVLGQTLTTEVGKTGSYAASQTHNDVRQDLKKADADLVAEVINTTLIRWMVDFNFGPQADYPAILLRTDEEQDLKPLAERDEILQRMGAKITHRYIYDTYGLPEPEGDEELLAGTPAPPEAAGPKSRAWPAPTTSNGGNEFAETSLFPDQTAVDAAIQPDQTDIDPAMKPILDLIRRGHTYEEIEDQLLEQYPEMDTTEFEKLLERAIFVSELWGRLNA